MKNFLSILCLLLSTALNAQELHIRNIQIDGLKTTKDATVLRELSFSVGDHITFQELNSLIDENKSNLLNQWLFNFVDFTPIIKGNEADILTKAMSAAKFVTLRELVGLRTNSEAKDVGAEH